MFAAQNWRKTGTLAGRDKDPMEERKQKTTDKKTDEPITGLRCEECDVQEAVGESFIQKCLNSPIFFVIAQPVVVFLLYFVFKFLS